jgi:hypothetical protein
MFRKVNTPSQGNEWLKRLPLRDCARCREAKPLQERGNCDMPSRKPDRVAGGPNTEF